MCVHALLVSRSLRALIGVLTHLIGKLLPLHQVPTRLFSADFDGECFAQHEEYGFIKYGECFAQHEEYGIIKYGECFAQHGEYSIIKYGKCFALHEE